MGTQPPLSLVVQFVPYYPASCKGYQLRALLFTQGYGPYHDQTWVQWIKRWTEGKPEVHFFRRSPLGLSHPVTHSAIPPILIRLPGNALSRPRSAADRQFHVPPYTPKPPKPTKPRLKDQLTAANARLRQQLIKNNP